MCYPILEHRRGTGDSILMEREVCEIEQTLPTIQRGTETVSSAHLSHLAPQSQIVGLFTYAAERICKLPELLVWMDSESHLRSTPHPTVP